MPDAGGSINIILQDATGSVAVRGYSDMLIIGDDGTKTETFTPRGLDAAGITAAGVGNITVDGISQFEGLVNESKELVIPAGGASGVWDGGDSVAIAINSTYTLYDENDNNFLLITVAGTLPTAGTYDLVVGDAVNTANQVTVIQLEDRLLGTPVITDAAEQTCAADGTYPRPTPATKYAIYGSDETLLAISNTIGSDDISVGYQVYKLPKAYTSLTAVDADHTAGTEISKAAAKMFGNGAGTVSVMNCYDGVTEEYALCLTELETQNYDYDIIVPVVDVGDANFVLCAAHALTYEKILMAPKIGTSTAVRAAMTGFDLDESQYAICYDTATYSVAEIAGAAAAVIAQKSPWIPCEWGSVSGINAAGYSKDDLNTLEGTGSTLRVNTFIQVGTYTVLSSGRALKAGTWLDIPRTKQYLTDAVEDAWVSAKLQIANSNQKIPYTTTGLTRVESIIRKPLKRAQKSGALREDAYDAAGVLMPGFVISMPLIEDIPASYKTARQLPDVTITAYLSGAIETLNPVYLTISLGEV